MDREKLVSEDWVEVGKCAEVEKVGQYITCNINDEAIVVVRGTDHQLRALSRVCRHRGFDMLEGVFNPDGDLQGRCGKVERLRCPYHAWTYDLEGGLIAAPLSSQINEFEKTSIRLPEFPIKISQGLIFVSVPPLKTLENETNNSVIASN